MNLGEHFFPVFLWWKVTYMNGTSIFMLHWCHDNGTSLRQKGTKTETKLRQKGTKLRQGGELCTNT